MNLSSNISRRIRDSASIARLGSSIFQKVRIFFELLLRAVARSLPFFSMLLPEESEWKCRYHGTHFSFFLQGKHEEHMLIKEVFVDHIYDIGTTEPVSTIVDCGANIGITTLFFHALFPSARIIAVEPSPRSFERLSRMAGQFGNITPVHAAIGGKNGTTTFFIEEASLASSLLKRSDDAQEVQVPMVTFSGLLQHNSIAVVDILKFDIEGAEEHLFDGSAQTAIRSFIGEVHEDLMALPLEAFTRSLEPRFSFVLTPTKKRHRYIIKGTKS